MPAIIIMLQQIRLTSVNYFKLFPLSMSAILQIQGKQLLSPKCAFCGMAVIDIGSLLGCGCSLCDHTSRVVDGKGRTPRLCRGVLPFPSTTSDVWSRKEQRQPSSESISIIAVSYLRNIPPSTTPNSFPTAKITATTNSNTVPNDQHWLWLNALVSFCDRETASLY